MTKHNDSQTDRDGGEAPRRVERVESLLREAGEVHDEAVVEIYHRSSRRVRVRREMSAASPGVHEGEEDGLAIRIADRSGGGPGFGAATGAGSRAVRFAMEVATRSMPGPRSAGPLPADDGTLRADLERPASPIDPAALDRWLETATDELLASAPAALELQVVSAWVESGVTWEVLASSAGVRAVRSRARTWASFGLRWSAEGTPYERVRLVAARGPGALPTLDTLCDEVAALHGPTTGVDDGPLVFMPRPASRVVHTLARVLHLDRPSGSTPAGPAYVIREDPSRAGALFGGTVDDTGAPTDPLVLAENGRADGRFAWAGHAWRASFRDPPSVMPTNLTVEADASTPPTGGALVTDVRIVPLEPDRWMLEGLATLVRDGRPTGRGGRFRRTVQPRELPARCLASVGPAASTAKGVLTPSLVFDL